jgi:hypothetical protein
MRRYVVQAVHRGAISTRHQVPIHIDCDADGTVPELLLHVREALPLLDEQRGVGVSEIVEPNPSKTGLA